MRYDDMSAAQVYDQGVVPCIFGEWTPALVERGKPASGERVLDLACGTGAVTRAAARVVGEQGSVVGIDISPAMLEVARSHDVAPGSAPIEWKEASAQELPLPDDHVDLVLCQQGLQFFPDRAGALAELRRVLRSGGRVALSVWGDLARNPVQEAFNRSLLERAGAAIFTAPFSLGDPAEVERLLREAGFESVVVDQEERTAHFESVEHFAEVHVVGAAAVIPAFAELGADERTALIAASAEDLAPSAERYLAGGSFDIPMTSLVASARRS